MKTSLYERHVALGAKLVDFAGWQMPLQYKGIIHEHQCVRNHVGIFDVSHMGRISIRGKDAEKFLDFLSTNRLKDRENNVAVYTVLPNAHGGCVDDVILYKQSTDDYFMVVNAANRDKDLAHLQHYSKEFDVQVVDHYQGEGILAIQGPRAISIRNKLFPEIKLLKKMHFQDLTYEGHKIILSGTGYTGAGGFEIYAPSSIIPTLWDRILAEGRDEGIEPIGLGARDTLRLEMGFALYGHELTDQIAPNETVSAWTIDWEKKDFLGKQEMQTLENSGKKRTEWGLLLLEKGIAREGYPIFKEGKPVGVVTSGSFSPTLNQAVALILVEGQFHVGDPVEVQIRENRVKGQITSLPFINTK